MICWKGLLPKPLYYRLNLALRELEYVVDEARALKPIVAIAYRFGEGFDGAGASHVLAPAALLRLNARTEGGQIALGRYLVQRADSHGSVVCRINDIIEGIGWLIEEGGNRGRIRARVESTLDGLSGAGVLHRRVYAGDISRQSK